MPRISAVAILALLLSAGAANADGTTIYSGATIIDGTGAPPVRGRSIVVKDDHILGIVADAKAAKLAGPGATRVDMKGTYALPGLIDTHQHMATAPDRKYAEAFLRRFVYSGVTAIRDMAGDARQLADLSRGARFGEIASPDIYYVALMAGPEFFHDARTVASARGLTPGQVPWMRAINANTNLQLAIAEAKGTSATAIKIYADLPGPLVKAVTEEAHKQGLQVWAHAAVFPASPKEVVDAGVDVTSHICMDAYQTFKEMPPQYHNRPGIKDADFEGEVRPELANLFADMKARGTVMDATLYVYDAMWKVPNANPPPYCTLALAEKLAAQAHKAGVMISTGTDADTDWDQPYPAIFDEMELLVNHSGFTPMEAVEAATRIGARAIGKQGEFGTLEAGKLANIVFLAHNPLNSISNMRSVVETVKRGIAFRRADYQPITKVEAGTE